MARIAVPLLLLMAIVLTGCENMSFDRNLWEQKKFKFQEATYKPEPAGSVSIAGKRPDYSQVDATTLKSPIGMDKVVTEQGKKHFDTFCYPCHGPEGKGTGSPVAEKYQAAEAPKPANLTEDPFNKLTEGEMFVRVVEGFGTMAGYKTDVSDKEAWEIVAYVFRLQGRNAN